MVAKAVTPPMANSTIKPTPLTNSRNSDVAPALDDDVEQGGEQQEEAA